MITFDQFKQLDLRIGKVITCEEHPNADKLYVVTVETGDGTRQMVAGIRPFYTKEELLNRQVVIVNNLEPATIRGVRSEGMLLATKDGSGLAVLIPEKEVAVGSRVS
jgi:methionyl-tRNA synthetase